MAIEVKIKKWGNSMGVILPKELIEKQHLKENDTIALEIVRKSDLSHLIGILKGKKNKRMSGQAFKDMVREGWK